MSNQFRLSIFILALSVNLAGIIAHNGMMQWVSKPLIVLSLIAYVAGATKKMQLFLRIWMLLGLFFSWTGDILLIFQPRGETFFLLGLASFLLAHICYIIFFNQARSRESIHGRWWLLLIVLLYYSLLMSLLTPYLGEFKLPVKVYAVVINFMFMLAMHLYYLRNKTAGWLMLAGAFCFIVSDTVLAINKFYYSFEPAGFIIMLTYGLAQWLIAEGAVRYLHSIPKQ